MTALINITIITSNLTKVTVVIGRPRMMSPAPSMEEWEVTIKNFTLHFTVTIKLVSKHRNKGTIIVVGTERKE